MSEKNWTTWGEVAGEFMPVMVFPASQANRCPWLSRSFVADYKRGKQPIKRIEVRDENGNTVEPNRP